MASTKLASAAPLESSPKPWENLCRLCRTFSRTETAVKNGAQRLVKCHACGVGFVDPLPSPSYIESHFKDHYITDDLRLEQVYGELRRQALTLVAAQVRRKKDAGRILDIGCAGGFSWTATFARPNGRNSESSRRATHSGGRCNEASRLMKGTSYRLICLTNFSM